MGLFGCSKVLKLLKVFAYVAHAHIAKHILAFKKAACCGSGGLFDS